MTHHISRNPDFPDMTAANATTSPQVSMAREALAGLSEPQRLALAIEVVNQSRETSSRLQLRRLITAADRTAHELGRVALERGRL